MFLASFISGSFGLWVFTKNPDQKLNRLFLLLCLSVSWWSLGYGLMYCADTADLALALSRVGVAGAILIPTLFYHFTLLFLQRSRRQKVVYFYLGSVAFLLLAYTDLFLVNPKRFFWGYYPQAGSAYWPFLVFFYAGFGLSLLELFRAFRELKTRPQPHVTQSQVKYVLLSYVIATCSVSDYLPNYGIPVYPFAFLAAIGWVGMMAYAILRYRVIDVKLILRKTLIYSTTSVILTGMYVVTVMLIASFFNEWMWGQRTLLSSVITGVAVTLTFLPLFRWIQSVVDRLFFRFKIDREAKLMEFSAEMVRFDSDSMTRTLGKLLNEAFHPRLVALYLRQADKPDFIEMMHVSSSDLPPSLPAGNLWDIQLGQSAGPFLREQPGIDAGVREIMSRSKLEAVIPLISRGELLGFLLLGEKRSEEPYSNEDLVLLRILVNQATVAYERPKLLREMSGGFVHEIKMPLANIALPAELTYVETEQAMAGKRSIDELLPQIQRRMKYIMDQVFLASHRLEAVHQTHSMERQQLLPASLRSAWDQVIEEVGQSMAQANVRVQEEWSALLPEVRAETGSLEIVLSNLVRNALEAMASTPRDQRLLTVRTGSDAHTVWLEVEDKGVGVAAEHQARLFSTHFSTKGDGRGIGLTAARNMIERQGGTLTFRPSPNGGAIFRIQLPQSNFA